MRSGFLIVDKVEGVSSFDVVRKVRRLLGMKKVGHAGTLDPLATGLMLVAFGEGTKILEYCVGMDKVYEVEACFGFISDTFDAKGSLFEGLNKKIDQNTINKIIQGEFIGSLSQIPPKFSALKINGMRAYDLARKNVEFEMKAREVKVYGFEMMNYEWPIVKFRISCGSGTYIRSLIHDLGQRLGVGAYVKTLRRTVVGDFDLGMAIDVENERILIDDKIISLEDIAAKFPKINLLDDEMEGLRDGKVLLNKKIDQDEIMAFYKGKFIGVIERKGEGVKFRKVIVGG